ncbi:MAG: DUF4115 domain-containing protein [Anaerolineales bacterium]|nr:DUF4115 domain-containing protein [Anaerolineales bacterium]
MTIGQQLRQARQARSLSLEQAAQATRIRLHHLQALEEGRFEDLPSPAQVRGFLRVYAGYLKIDSAPLLDILDGAPPDDVVETPLPTPEGKPVVEQTPAEAIFAEIGGQLRSQRDILGLSIEDAERHTHIRAHYIRSLEVGDLDALPSPVQGRGMLNNYAGFLGLDVDALLLRFADGLQARLAARRSNRPRPSSTRRPAARPSGLSRIFSRDMIVGGVLIVALVAFTVWATLYISDLRNAESPQPTAPSIADILASTPLPSGEASPTYLASTLAPVVGETVETTLEFSPTVGVNTLLPPEPGMGDPTATATVPPTPEIGASVLQVYVVARQRAWMRIVADGQVVFEGRVVPGSAYTFAADERIELTTGNAAGLQVFFNQQDLGPLGIFGQVATRIYTLGGVQTPTPAISPTPTPSDTPTPGASQTPTSTLTPAP